jgi:hypothetical protein
MPYNNYNMKLILWFFDFRFQQYVPKLGISLRTTSLNWQCPRFFSKAA